MSTPAIPLPPGATLVSPTSDQMKLPPGATLIANESPAQKELRELDLPGVHKARTEQPLEGYPVPTPVSEAGLSALGKVGSGIVQGAKSMLPTAGATIEETAANVTKWAAQNGLKATGTAGAVYYLLHELLGGKKP